MFFVLVVVVTCSPSFFAIWIARLPTPPAPAWIRTRWPVVSAADSRSAWSAVSAASGIDAACTMSSDAGFTATTLSSAHTCSARPPMRSFSSRT